MHGLCEMEAVQVQHGSLCRSKAAYASAFFCAWKEVALVCAAMVTWSCCLLHGCEAVELCMAGLFAGLLVT